MRGRTIRFQNRRILIFCGKKKTPPHSIYDVFGSIDENISLNHSAGSFELENPHFGKVDENIELDEDADGITTSSILGEIDEVVAVDHLAEGNAYTAVFGEIDESVSADHFVKGLNTESRLGKIDESVSVNHDTSGVVTSSLFGSVDDKTEASHKVEGFSTANPIFGEIDEAKENSHTIEGIVDSAVVGEIDESISLTHSVEGYVETPVIEISAGNYGMNDKSLLSKYHPFSLSVPLKATLLNSNVRSYDSLDIDVSYEIFGVTEYSSYRSLAVGHLNGAYIEWTPDISNLEILQDTEVTQAEKETFLSIFYKK